MTGEREHIRQIEQAPRGVDRMTAHRRMKRLRPEAPNQACRPKVRSGFATCVRTWT